MSQGFVIIIGGGRVGRALARALKEHEVDYRIVETNPARILDANYVEGSAADYNTLQRAGIDHAPAMVITTHDDDMNIYLTIYCRRLRPDIQIISRATRERNVSTLHRAGADFVLSYASMGATAIFNYLRRAGVVVIAEGLHLAETNVPDTLAGRTLGEAAIPAQTGCNVVALRSEAGVTINPEPSTVLKSGVEIILIGTPRIRAAIHETLWSTHVASGADCAHATSFMKRRSCTQQTRVFATSQLPMSKEEIGLAGDAVDC